MNGHAISQRYYKDMVDACTEDRTFICPELAELNESLSPYSFSQELVNRFGFDVVSIDVWRKLRLGLLLSLVSCPVLGYSGHPLNMLVLTKGNQPQIQRMLKYAASIREDTQLMNVIQGLYTSSKDKKEFQTTHILTMDLDLKTKKQIDMITEGMHLFTKSFLYCSLNAHMLIVLTSQAKEEGKGAPMVVWGIMDLAVRKTGLRMPLMVSQRQISLQTYYWKHSLTLICI